MSARLPRSVARPGAARIVAAGLLALATLCGTLLPAAPARAQVRIKDITTIEGVRGNQLVGYGLVMGLQGTGDQLRNVPFTQQSLTAMLERMGVNVADRTLMTRNTAAVMVTATLPAFARQGTPLDVMVSSMGDARSLNGGTLVATPLLGADGEVYAVAQGPLVVGGFAVAGQAQSISSGVTTSAKVAGGAIVEREVRSIRRDQQVMRLALRTPDYTTAIRIEEVVNRKFGRGTARVLDMGTLEITVPGSLSDRIPLMVSQMEMLEVRPEVTARVVVDARSGTIVVGARVRIEPVAITHGNMVIRVTETPIVSQPNAFAGGQTAVVPRTQIDIDDQRRNRLLPLPRANTLQALVNGLNALGLAPRDLVAVMIALKAAGALHADLEFI